MLRCSHGQTSLRWLCSLFACRKWHTTHLKRLSLSIQPGRNSTLPPLSVVCRHQTRNRRKTCADSGQSSEREHARLLNRPSQPSMSDCVRVSWASSPIATLRMAPYPCANLHPRRLPTRIRERPHHDQRPLENERYRSRRGDSTEAGLLS